MDLNIIESLSKLDLKDTCGNKVDYHYLSTGELSRVDVLAGRWLVITESKNYFSGVNIITSEDTLLIPTFLEYERNLDAHKHPMFLNRQNEEDAKLTKSANNIVMTLLTNAYLLDFKNVKLDKEGDINNKYDRTIWAYGKQLSWRGNIQILVRCYKDVKGLNILHFEYGFAFAEQD